MYRKPTPAELRYGVISREDVAVYHQIIMESAADLAAVGEAMEAAEIDKMKIDGAKKFPRGQQLLSEFVGKLEVALARALSDSRLASQRDRVERREK